VVTPLNNLDAELGVVGGMMWMPAQRECIGALTERHFHDPVLGRLFTEITRRIDAGIVADAVTLREWALTDPGAAQVPRLLILAMERAAPIASHAAAYADDIRALYARREAIRVQTESLERLKAGDDVLEVVAAGEHALRDLAGDDAAEGADLTDACEDFMGRIDDVGQSTGLYALDKRLAGLFRGDLIVLAGRPSMGKTTLATQISRNVARRGKVHFASLDMSKDGLAIRALSAATFDTPTPTPYFNLRNGAPNVDRSLLARLASTRPRALVIDDRAAQSLAQLEASARATRRRLKGLDLIVVDYLQLMRAVRSDGRVNEVSEISAGLKAIAKRLDVPVLALSQLSRGVEGRENKRPTLSDLRDSGAIEQDADVVLGVYRESYYHERAEPDAGDVLRWREWDLKRRSLAREIEVITLKQRMGPIGTDMLTAWLEFDTILDRSAA